MEVYRIVKEAFSKSLEASGRANRWNKDDQFMMYTGSSRALSSLELIVHRNAVAPSFKYAVMIISIPDDLSFYTNIPETDLPKNWRSMLAYPELQEIGSNWYQTKKSLVLKVPSAVIPKENNYIININHPDFVKVSLSGSEDYFWDDRLL